MAPSVTVLRVVPNLTVSNVESAAAQHRAVLGLSSLMSHGWIETLGDDAGHQLSVMDRDASAPLNPHVSVFVNDVTAAFEAAQDAGVEIVYPMTSEPWGVTRFFYRADDGNIINVGMHSDS